jgi:penicillin-binding protein 1A
MPLVIYIAVLIAALSGVLLGLDRMAPPPPAKPMIQAAPAEPIRHTASPAVVAAPVERQRQPALAQQPPAPAPADNPQQQTVSQSPTETPAPTCNYRACENAYQSFRASDCTYQPYGVPRRLCTK